MRIAAPIARLRHDYFDLLSDDRATEGGLAAWCASVRHHVINTMETTKLCCGVAGTNDENDVVALNQTKLHFANSHEN